MKNKLPLAKDKILFTPGPLTTSNSVKQAMLRDLGSRDTEFIKIIKEIREELLDLGNVKNKDYETVIIQGSGTFSLESVLTSSVGENDKILFVINGAYGRRLAQIAKIHNLNKIELEFEENEIPDLAKIDQVIKENPDLTHLSVIHCETTTGILNPIEEIGKLAKKYGLTYFVDSMSAFGAVPVDLAKCEIDFLVSSANKNIEGVPGFGFILVRKEALENCKNNCRTLSLDLYTQWQGLEKNGQFRFTPPTHSLLAFRQALRELKLEGGVEARNARYKENHKILREGMKKIGFQEYIDIELQSPIISTFYNPKHKNFDFQIFYNKLNDSNIVIYPGKTTKAECFRIGSIGRIFPSDIKNLLNNVENIISEMKLEL